MSEDAPRRELLLRYSMTFSAFHRALGAIELGDDDLPGPLMGAYREMRDAKTEDEAQAAAKKYLLLAKEWSD